MDATLPYINIKNSEVKKFNDEVIKLFEAKAEDVLGNTDNKAIYTVKYKGSIENNILSVIIYSNLKQDTSAQRVIITTFNYDLANNIQLSLDDTIQLFELDKMIVQSKINSDIDEEKKKAKELNDLGYSLFERDFDKDYYKIENVKEFFIYKNNIYVIFAYGNEDVTSQKDIVII